MMGKISGPASGFGFVTKRARAAIASGVICQGWGTSAWCVVTPAIARELAGFIWAIARRVPPAAS